MKSQIDGIKLDQPVSEIPERQDAADAPEFNQPSINDQLTIPLIGGKKADSALREQIWDKAYKIVIKTLYGWCW